MGSRDRSKRRGERKRDGIGEEWEEEEEGVRGAKFTRGERGCEPSVPSVSREGPPKMDGRGCEDAAGITHQRRH